MDTVALRFSDSIAPTGGTIKAHEAIIKKLGYVWYGKFGSSISAKVRETILKNEKPKVLLIHSGTNSRYWAVIEDISRTAPSANEFPSYYHDKKDRCGSWLKVLRFEKAESDIMSKCFVKSSGAVLSNASRRSMSPYFIIEYKEMIYAE